MASKLCVLLFLVCVQLFPAMPSLVMPRQQHSSRFYYIMSRPEPPELPEWSPDNGTENIIIDGIGGENGDPFIAPYFPEIYPVLTALLAPEPSLESSSNRYGGSRGATGATGAIGATGPANPFIRTTTTRNPPTRPGLLKTTTRRGLTGGSTTRRRILPSTTTTTTTTQCLIRKGEGDWQRFINPDDGSMLPIPSNPFPNPTRRHPQGYTTSKVARLTMPPTTKRAAPTTRRQQPQPTTARRRTTTSTKATATLLSAARGPTFVDMVTIPIIDPADVDVLANKPTQMLVLSKIVANNPGLFPGFVQMDMCTYELLEICSPAPEGAPFCTADQCYARCMSLPACRRVTFTPDGLCQMETRNCQKDAIISSGNSFLRVSPVYAAFPGNCPEHFLLDDSLYDDKKVGCTRCSIADCRSACDMMPNCAGFSYADASTPLGEGIRQCYIKTDTCKNPTPGTHIFYHKLAVYM